MNVLDKLTYLMNKQGLNKSTLSQASNIPYTTIDGLYKKGYEKSKMSTLKALADFFGVTLDSFCNDSVDELVYKVSLRVSENVSPEEAHLLTSFRSLNAEGKEKALEYIEDLTSMSKYKKSNQSQVVDKNA